jgi:nicotinate-nucleotide pyrophosphorylase (carboxylating)
MIENPIFLDPVIRTALEEDLGPGDLTTDAIVDPTAMGKGVLVARESLVLAGLPVFKRVFDLLSPDMVFEFHFQDGGTVAAGAEIGVVSGRLGAILRGERTALNFLQRMSGIATLTRSYVDKVGAQKVKVVDTRKTVPGLRVLDKYAVRMGGGFNHRLGLFDGILIKDNHIAAAGSVRKAVSLAKKNVPHTVKIEVEVEDLKGVKEAIQAGADAVLLDNMSPEMMGKAVDVVGGRLEIEASGNITLQNVEEVARTGVNLISVGALTHSPRAVDLSLEVIKL